MPWSTVIDRGTVALLRTRFNFVQRSFVDAPLGAAAVEFATLVWVDWFNTRRRLEPIDYRIAGESKPDSRATDAQGPTLRGGAPPLEASPGTSPR